MDNKIKQLIDSGILEEYALGLTSQSQNAEMEKYLQESADVRKAFDEIQDGIANLAKINAVKPPAELRDKILSSIDSGTVPTATSPRSFKTLFLAASLAALALLLFSVVNWNNSKNALSDLETKEKELADLKIDCDQQGEELEKYKSEFDMMNSPETERVYLAGNNLAPEFKTYAYWNTAEQKSYLHVVEMPALENKQCYQLWADVDGEMISLGVIKAEEGVLAEIPFLANAESLNITIEPDGGSDHPNVANLIASQAI